MARLMEFREKEERERARSALICTSKKVCDVWKSDGEVKGVETKQARLVKRKSGKCGTRNHLVSRSSMGYLLARVLNYKRRIRTHFCELRPKQSDSSSHESSWTKASPCCHCALFRQCFLERLGSISFANLFGSVRRARRGTVERGLQGSSNQYRI